MRRWGALIGRSGCVVPRCYPQNPVPGCFLDQWTSGRSCFPLGGRIYEGGHPAPSNKRLDLTRAPSAVGPYISY